jgi:peptidoglycan hydrolase-like protein with peptidoglycan-binding domain
VTAKSLLACLAVAAALACSRRHRPPSPPPPSAAPPAAEAGTWAALPKDLQPEQIRLVQRALATRGFPVEPTGRLDDATRVGLRDFQRSRGLAETGDLNPDTAAALDLDPEAVMPVRGSQAAGGGAAGDGTLVSPRATP